MSLVKVIVALRAKLNKTQAGLAAEMGVTTRTVTRLEAGEPPSIKALFQLSEVAKKNSLYAYEKYFDGEREVLIGAKTGRESDIFPSVSRKEMSEWSAKLLAELGEIQSILEAQKTKMDGWATQVLREHIAGIEDVVCRIRLFTEDTSDQPAPKISQEIITNLLAASQAAKPDKRALKKLGRQYAKQVAEFGKTQRS